MTVTPMFPLEVAMLPGEELPLRIFEPRYAALVGLIQNLGALIGFASFGFLADAFGRKPTTILYYVMCLILTPVVYLWVKDIHLLLLAFAVYGFFIQGSSLGPRSGCRSSFPRACAPLPPASSSTRRA